MKKETVVFVHGAWHGKWCWEEAYVPKFEEAGYEVVTFDLPGHNLRGKVKGINSYRLRDYTAALEAEVAKLDALPILIGHSMGGLVVQKYLENKDCKKAVLMASVPPSGAMQATLRFMKKGYFYPSLLSLDLYKLVNSPEKCQHAFFSPHLPQNQLLVYTDQLCSESFLAFLDMLVPRVRVKPEFDTPMLVVGAKNDTIFSEKENQYTAKKYQAELIMFDNIAHDMMLDDKTGEVLMSILHWVGK